MALEVKTVNQISENLDNKRVPITKKSRSHGSIPYYGASGIVDYVEEYIFDEDLLLVSEDGANLLARTYPIAFSIRGKTWVNNHAHVLRFKDKTSQRFVELYLNSIKLDDFVSGMAQPKLNQKMLNKIPIPFPQLSEQKRIVAILDEAFESIAKAKENAEKNLKNAKEIFESYLQNVFENKGEGWEEKTLGEITYVKSGGTPTRIKKEYWEGDIAWYSSGELNDLYTKEPERYINDLSIDNSNAKLFPKGSLLIGMYDTAALKMSILDREATFNQAIAGVKPNDKTDLIFILHSINSIKPNILDLRRGVRQKNLNLGIIKNIPIYLPTLKQQQSIVQKLDALSAETKRLEAVCEKKLADLEELKKSILQKAFDGALK